MVRARGPKIVIAAASIDVAIAKQLRTSFAAANLAARIWTPKESDFQSKPSPFLPVRARPVRRRTFPGSLRIGAHEPTRSQPTLDALAAAALIERVKAERSRGRTEAHDLYPDVLVAIVTPHMLKSGEAMRVARSWSSRPNSVRIALLPTPLPDDVPLPPEFGRYIVKSADDLTRHQRTRTPKPRSSRRLSSRNTSPANLIAASTARHRNSGEEENDHRAIVISDVPARFRGTIEWVDDPKGPTSRFVVAIKSRNYSAARQALEDGADARAAWPPAWHTALHYMAARATPELLLEFDGFWPQRLLLDSRGYLPSRVGFDAGNGHCAVLLREREIQEATELAIDHSLIERVYLMSGETLKSIMRDLI